MTATAVACCARLSLSWVPCPLCEMQVSHFRDILQHHIRWKLRLALCQLSSQQAVPQAHLKCMEICLCNCKEFGNLSIKADASCLVCRLGQLEGVCPFASPASQASVNKFGFTPMSAHYQPLKGHKAAQVITTIHSFSCPDKATVVIGRHCTYTARCKVVLHV